MSPINLDLLLSECGNPEMVALEMDYYPAISAWKLKSTYGLPLTAIALAVSRHGLKMDWIGIRYEAAKEGANIDGEVVEAREEWERSRR